MTDLKYMSKYVLIVERSNGRLFTTYTSDPVKLYKTLLTSKCSYPVVKCLALFRMPTNESAYYHAVKIRNMSIEDKRRLIKGEISLKALYSPTKITNLLLSAKNMKVYQLNMQDFKPKKQFKLISFEEIKNSLKYSKIEFPDDYRAKYGAKTFLSLKYRIDSYPATFRELVEIKRMLERDYSIQIREIEDSINSMIRDMSLYKAGKL